MNQLLLIFIIHSLSCVSAQESMIFCTDTTMVFRYESSEKIKEQNYLWIYRDQEISYGSDSLVIPFIENKLDTLFFKYRSRTDTLLFIHHAGHYEFFYNACCSGFNIRNQNTKRFIPNNFILSDIEQDSMLIRVGGAWGLIGAGIQDTIQDYCQSAMSSNVKLIRLYEIDDEREKYPENSLYCFYQNGEESEVFYNPGKKIREFLFLPLNLDGVELKCLEGLVQF